MRLVTYQQDKETTILEQGVRVQEAEFYQWANGLKFWLHNHRACGENNHLTLLYKVNAIVPFGWACTCGVAERIGADRY